MRILVISHAADIDGMGPAILAKLAFGEENVDVMFVETADTSAALCKALDEKKYDQYFVTDVCPDLATLFRIDENEQEKNNVLIFDHHKTVLTNTLKGKENPFNFLQIKTALQKGPTCGTELFYRYLLENGLIKKTKFLKYLVELIRLHDTWEWVKDPKNIDAWGLNAIFQKGNGTSDKKQVFVNNFYQKAISGASEIFTGEEREFIESEWAKLIAECDSYISKMHVETIYENTIGVIDEVPMRLKSDISERIRELGGLGLDAVCTVIAETQMLSLRTISGMDVGEFALKFGGGGHAAAAGGIEVSDFIKNVFNIGEQKEL